MWTGARLSHGSNPRLTYAGSEAKAAISARICGSVTTTRVWPWANPALGALRPASAIRSTAAGSTGPPV